MCQSIESQVIGIPHDVLPRVLWPPREYLAVPTISWLADSISLMSLAMWRGIFLGLDHFYEAFPSMDLAEEDAFCHRMRAMNAKWFENETEEEKQPSFKIVNGKRVGQTEVWFG